MEKIWIIRVKGRISGPFSTSEIKQMIESKKLSIKDEINKPLKQWVYVKNASELHETPAQTATDIPAFKKRRPKKNWMEDTVILDSPPQMETEETTAPDSPAQPDTTKTAQVIEKQNTEPLLKELDLEKAEVIDYKVDEFESPSESSAQFAELEQVKKKASIKSKKAVKHIWLGFLILFSGTMLFYFSKYITQTTAPSVSELPQARKFFHQGEYAKALSLFKKSTLENDSDRLKLASLLVQMEGDIYQAQIQIEKIKHLSPLEQSRLQILKGIIAHKNNNRSEAENLFHSSLPILPFLGTLHKVILNIKDRGKALSLLNQTDFSMETADSNSRLLLFLKAYLEPPEKEDSSALTKLLTSQQGDYKQEALLLLLNRQVTANKEKYNQTIQQILDQDPYLTKEYKNDILSYTPHFVWKEFLLDLCSNITRNNANSYFIALKSLCLVQSGHNTLALKNIEKARTQSPQDPLISSLFVFVSSQNNLNEQTLLDHSLKQSQNYVLPLILKARFCQKQKDIYCAHSHWSQLNQKEILFLSAITGEAWSYYKMGNNKSAQELIQTGLFISNRYKPLIQLKDSL